jgi:hypothetical protein
MSWIRDPEKLIPDPGVKVPDPGSATLSLFNL